MMLHLFFFVHDVMSEKRRIDERFQLADISKSQKEGAFLNFNFDLVRNVL